MSSIIELYSRHAGSYDQWYTDNQDLYEQEVNLVRRLIVAGLPPDLSVKNSLGLEVGAGSGRFAARIPISHGLEPAAGMAELARKRGVNIISGLAEDLPFPALYFDYVAFLTSLCFVNDADLALREASRVLKPTGFIVIAFLNKGTAAGRLLLESRHQDPFLARARLYDEEELRRLLRANELRIEQSLQIVMSEEVGPAIRSGLDQGLYCGVRVRRELSPNA
ncbi:MAG TPA: methyltransferase domain-containing protein [Clostridiaceae bacterium]|nr:methyltransferase domain-containing protein [Clostridiaceae bacterium]